jgi:deoxycytidylate deaminase
MRHSVTAIIYNKKGRVISIGQNSYLKTHPLQAIHAHKVGESHKIYLHAEVSAIAKCRDIQKAHRILVMRYNKQGEPVMAKPCKICLSAIHSTPIKIIEHT